MILLNKEKSKSLKNGKVINHEVVCEESYHTFFGEVSSTQELRERTLRRRGAVTTNDEKSAEAVVAKKLCNGSGAKGGTKHQLSLHACSQSLLNDLCETRSC